jgi:opacity protein-like surface antigen
MIKDLKFTGFLLVCLLSAFKVWAQESNSTKDYQKFYLKPYAGFIGIQDMSLQLVSTNQATNIEVDNGFGFTTGISLGYNFTENITSEVGWEYKTNDITIENNSLKSSGDYASNFIYLNGIYNVSTNSRFKPYLGLGLSLIQEIDLDFGDDNNTSYSESGNVGFQGIFGLDFNFSRKWALNWEAKYVAFSEFDMENEANDDQLNNLKYAPFIFNIGIKYEF